MKRYLILGLLLTVLQTACKKDLEVSPRGVLSEDQVSSPQQAEGFVTAAYSQLGNDEINRAFSMYQYGNIRADDAYKGGRGTDDGDVFHFMETFVNSRPDQWNYDAIWFHAYIGVRRANEALRILNKFTESEFPLVETRKAEVRFLRGYWYFMLKNLFKNVPYIDETVPAEEYKNIVNKNLSNDEFWEKIAGDFEFASNNLPDPQPQIGRVNQIAAYAYLAKTRLYQAYEQNDKHKVVNINKDRLDQVITAADKVLSSRFKLQPDFANNFLPGPFENGIESLFAVQFSTDDGVGRGRVNYGDMLTVPQGLGCCDFQKPSQNLVNAFRTNEDGLPLFDTFNSSDVNFNQNTVDPRLDHTVARPGNPWKYDLEEIFTEGWSRSPSVYGYYNSLKENVTRDRLVNYDPFYGNTKARIIIRLADVLLFKAEALIELGRHNEALPFINELRTRAANSTARLVKKDGSALAQYNVKPYVAGVNINWTQENARKALRFERRLEMALEGSRFFDLIRWGVAEPVMNSYLNVEKTKRDFLKDAKFSNERDEYLPIPQNQIFWSENKYTQNPGY